MQNLSIVYLRSGEISTSFYKRNIILSIGMLNLNKTNNIFDPTKCLFSYLLLIFIQLFIVTRLHLGHLNFNCFQVFYGELARNI